MHVAFLTYQRHSLNRSMFSLWRCCFDLLQYILQSRTMAGQALLFLLVLVHNINADVANLPFTKQYVFQTKMRSSRPNAMVLKNVLTKRLYIEQFLLLKNCNYLDYNNYWKVLFQNLESSSPTNPNP